MRARKSSPADTLPPLDRLQDAVLPALDNVTLAEIHYVLAHGPMTRVLPAALKSVFWKRREKEFSRIAVPGIPLLYFMLFVCTLAVHLLFSRELKTADGSLWYQHMAVTTCILTVAAVFTRIPAMMPSFMYWVSFLVTLVQVNKVYFAIVVSSTLMSQYEVSMSMMLVVISMLAMRLSLVVATASALLGSILACLLAKLQGYSLFSLVPLVSFGMVAVCFFVAFLLERQDKLGFLQAVLLAHESAERKRLNNELMRMSKTDALTGLANRRHFISELMREWERSRRERMPIAVILVDIDYFSAYNDAYGQTAGDECLVQLATTLPDVLRRVSDIPARYGGDEFVILLPSTDLQGAYRVAERMLAAVDVLEIRHKRSLVAQHLSISIGVAASVPDDIAVAEVMVSAADVALSLAKQRGRHRIGGFSATGPGAAGQRSAQG